MKIGVPKEVKNNEYRVGLTPESVKALFENNHEVFIQKSITQMLLLNQK